MTDQTEHTSEAVGLKACPHCGGPAEAIQLHDDNYMIRCEDCWCQSPECERADHAVRAWNQRAPDADLVEALRRLADAADACDPRHDDPDNPLQEAVNAAYARLAKATAK